jgi:hypothetical protein
MNWKPLALISAVAAAGVREVRVAAVDDDVAGSSSGVSCLIMSSTGAPPSP